jgi:hypothetical protein
MLNGDSQLRQELIAARERVVKQIEILRNPMRSYDQYPEGIAKLQKTLAEIDEALAQMNTPSA